MATGRRRQPRRHGALMPTQATLRRVCLAAPLAILLLLAACTSDTEAPNDPPETTPTGAAVSPTPVDPVAAAEQAALEAYRCMWAAYDAAGRAPAANPEDDRLEQCATGDALGALVRGLTSMRDDGRVIEGEVVLSPQVVSLEPEDSPVRAQVRDCGDSTNWLTVYLDTGEITDDPRGRQLVVADLEDVGGGTWKVTSFGVREIGSC